MVVILALDLLNGFEVLNEFCPEGSLSVPNLPSLATTFAATPAALTNSSPFCSRVTVAKHRCSFRVEISLPLRKNSGGGCLCCTS